MPTTSGKTRGDQEASVANKRKSKGNKTSIGPMRVSPKFAQWFNGLVEKFRENHAPDLPIKIPDSFILERALELLAREERYEMPKPKR